MRAAKPRIRSPMGGIELPEACVITVLPCGQAIRSDQLPNYKLRGFGGSAGWKGQDRTRFSRAKFRDHACMGHLIGIWKVVRGLTANRYSRRPRGRPTAAAALHCLSRS